MLLACPAANASTVDCIVHMLIHQEKGLILKREFLKSLSSWSDQTHEQNTICPACDNQLHA